MGASVSALLIDAPVDRHFAQIHRDSKALVKSVSLFLETGLKRGHGVIAFATAAHTEQFLAHIERSGLNPETCRRSGQLRLLDANAMLDRVMRAGMPDWSSFRRTAGSILESMQTLAAGTTRVYGEMVNVLWRAGSPQAAIRLEEYWNELARWYPFSLFCGYMLDSQDPEIYQGPLHEIGHTHSDVIETAEDERFRAALDQAARDIFGSPLSEIVGFSGQEHNPGEQRLPPGQRTMLWIMRNMPDSSAQVLERARQHYQRLTSEDGSGLATA